MIKRVLVLGASGNFGRHITAGLAGEPHLQLILAGRTPKPLYALAEKHHNPAHPPLVAIFDIHADLPQHLKTFQPDILIHTSGPFQAQDYTVAKACIDHGCHYIDLADARDFVCNIKQLHQSAVDNKVCIISGASSVPCLTAAVIDHYLPSFSTLQSVDSGIATSQRINVGLATIKSTLSYAGKPFTLLKNAEKQAVYGWQGMVRRLYPELGKRFFSYCDVPDLELFPARYPSLKTHAFRVSLEVTFVHWCMWGLSWLVRAGLIHSLPRWAPWLRRLSKCLDRLGSNNSGFHVEMQGIDQAGHKKTLTFYLIAYDRYGPFIPSMPAILCAKKIASGQTHQHGAYPCLDLIPLEEYLQALDPNKIKTMVT